jgi:regulator of nucleoside diphosphate kinase
MCICKYLFILLKHIIIHACPVEMLSIFFEVMDINMELEKLIISEQDYARLSKLRDSEILEDELSRAVLVPSDQVPANVVKMYSRVTYVDESNGATRDVDLVYPEEADSSTGKISVLSPVGSALLGLEVGQTIEWLFPNHQSRLLRVINVMHTT